MLFPDLAKIFSFERVTAPEKPITYSYPELAKLFFDEADKEWSKLAINGPYEIGFKVLRLNLPGMNLVDIERMTAFELIESFKKLLPTRGEAYKYSALDGDGIPMKIRYYLSRIGKNPSDFFRYGVGVLERLNGSTQILLFPPGFNSNTKLPLWSGFKSTILNHRLVEIDTEEITKGFPRDPISDRRFRQVKNIGYSYWQPA